uniref:Uncharacterized protein n=1 Tax=Arundo donax TaxID=35708 RepID=A0A0A8XYZ4_ARUDO
MPLVLLPDVTQPQIMFPTHHTPPQNLHQNSATEARGWWLEPVEEP